MAADGTMLSQKKAAKFSLDQGAEEDRRLVETFTSELRASTTKLTIDLPLAPALPRFPGLGSERRREGHAEDVAMENQTNYEENVTRQEDRTGYSEGSLPREEGELQVEETFTETSFSQSEASLSQRNETLVPSGLSFGPSETSSSETSLNESGTSLDQTGTSFRQIEASLCKIEASSSKMQDILTLSGISLRQIKPDDSETSLDTSYVTSNLSNTSFDKTGTNFSRSEPSLSKIEESLSLTGSSFTQSLNASDTSSCLNEENLKQPKPSQNQPKPSQNESRLRQIKASLSLTGVSFKVSQSETKEDGLNEAGESFSQSESSFSQFQSNFNKTGIIITQGEVRSIKSETNKTSISFDNAGHNPSGASFSETSEKSFSQTGTSFSHSEESLGQSEESFSRAKAVILDTSSLTSLTSEEFSNLPSEGCMSEASVTVLTLPVSLAGWSYSGERAGVLISPSGLRFKSKRAAIKAMYMQEGEGETVEGLRELYVAQGWRREGLPRGWVGKRGEKNYDMIAADGTQLDRKSKAAQHALEIGGQADEELVKNWNCPLFKRVNVSFGPSGKQALEVTQIGEAGFLPGLPNGRFCKKLDGAPLEMLERYYLQHPYPDMQEKEELAERTRVHLKTVSIWFQNRRGRDKKNGIELPQYIPKTGGSSLNVPRTGGLSIVKLEPRSLEPEPRMRLEREPRSRPGDYTLSPLLPLQLSFSSRREAFQAMVHSTASDQDKASLFDSLAAEGWRASPLLPKGWVFQGVVTGEVNFFNKHGTFLEGTTKALHYFKVGVSLRPVELSCCNFYI